MKLVSEPTKTPYSILLIGPPGGRKTTLALQFPNVGYVNLDLNESGPTKKLKELGLLQPFFMQTVTLDDDGNKIIDADARFQRFATGLDLMIAEPKISTIVIDSLTTLDDILYGKVKKQMSRAHLLELQDWRLFRQYLVGTINIVRNSGKNSIFLCHEEIVTDKQGSVDAYVPAVSTKIRDYFGGFFTDIWRSEVRPGAMGKEKQILRTVSTTRSELKNAWSLPSEIEDPTYEKLAVYFNK
jgi:hypothetical protein